MAKTWVLDGMIDSLGETLKGYALNEVESLGIGSMPLPSRSNESPLTGGEPHVDCHVNLDNF